MGVTQLVVMMMTAFSLTLDAVAAKDPVVSTKSGDLSGAVLKSFLGNKYFSFKGIPYAEPPVGALRFEKSRPHAGWSGVRKAKVHGHKCLQFDMFAQQGMQGSEDCLFANVYTPRLPSERERVKLPVMVFIHGGGFVTGEGDVSFYAPDYLMDQQVVLVTFNYRLGPFGFLTTGDASAPGNYGLHDQVLALQWVQANIAAFGGDADAVTIFGESAGGASVGLQVLSPRSRGLFSRAISQSGASFSSFAASGEPQGEKARRLAAMLGCEQRDGSAMVDCLRQKPADELLRLSVELGGEALGGVAMIYKPRVDAEAPAPFLPEDPHVALKEGRFNRVPWMSGLNADEGAFMVFMMTLVKDTPVHMTSDWDRWAKVVLDIKQVTDDPAGMAERIYRHYFGNAAVTDENLKTLSDMVSDRMFITSVTSEIDLAAAHTPVYKYLLDHTGPGRQKILDQLASIMGVAKPKDLGVPHAEDLMYLFKPMFSSPVTPDSVEHKMIRFMVSLWTSFARHGYPSTDVLPLPSWPIYTAERQEHMRLNLSPSVGRAAFSERLKFWKQLDIYESWRLPQPSLSRDEL